MEARLVIGIPTVSRPRGYLEATVASVLAGVPEGRNVELVVLNADDPPALHEGAVRLSTAGGRRVTVVDNPGGHAALRPRLDDAEWLRREAELVRSLDDDEWAYRRWMVKQNLDHAMLMERCAARGDLYLQLDDDVVAADRWYEQFVAWKDAYFPDDAPWRLLTLYHPGVRADRQPYPLDMFATTCALVLRTRDLPALAAYIRARCTEAPVDWLIRDHLIATDGQAFVRTPCLFQHVGVVSSLAGKVQFAGAPTFQESRIRRGARRLEAVARMVGLVVRGEWAPPGRWAK